MNLPASSALGAAPWRILSRFQTVHLLQAHERGQTSAFTSLNLGLGEEQVELNEKGIQLADGESVTWSQLERINEVDNSCFRLKGAEIEPIRLYSEKTAHTYQLMPTSGAPALLISGFVMHRIRDVTPEQGAQKMVKALSPIRGRLLDTATGLGYAAIEAARWATEVVTIELDEGCQAMIRENPWSAPLLAHPKITQLLGDSSELVKGFASDSFSCILHDPPAINVAGELYSEKFYMEARRVLSRGGKLFHYIGDPASASGGRVTQGVLKRLKNAGFMRVKPAPAAFGVVAYK
jgi:uncharacterized protein